MWVVQLRTIEAIDGRLAVVQKVGVERKVEGTVLVRLGHRSRATEEAHQNIADQRRTVDWLNGEHVLLGIVGGLTVQIRVELIGSVFLCRSVESGGNSVERIWLKDRLRIREQLMGKEEQNREEQKNRSASKFSHFLVINRIKLIEFNRF